MKKFILFLLIAFANFTVVFAQRNLIPMPIQLEMGHGSLDLSKGVRLHTQVKDSLDAEIINLKGILAEWHIPIVASNKQVPTITLTLRPSAVHDNKEGYTLKVVKDGIFISSATKVGIFYALQTLRQFDIHKKKLACADIVDFPAFSWRGFLVDVGRNYQPIDMLKEQIDVMAKYKLNVLHFHFTEDIAWRLASKKYPGLTAPNMITRWKDNFYTEEEFKELIQYCQERHITFLPEVDMPGHSAAFRRFFGVDMQSDSGMVYIKELLKEFKETYPSLEIFHIGGDEVKITNKNFMPEITKFVEDLGYKKTVGWDPGSNLSPQTMRQMWMGGPKVIKEEGDLVYIESKHLYVNHIDPLETVTTLFHRQLGGVDKEHKNFVGATLCSWPDRAVSAPIDMFYQSAIYPAMLAFAERSWRGAGRYQWISNILPESDPDYKSFVDFEARLLNHKTAYFADKPFPYVKQLGLKWDLIGPFDNQGDVQKSFSLEQGPYASDTIVVSQTIEGGTVVLKHWFGPIIETAIQAPEANTTWYARTKIWSDKDAVQSFWIGFNDFSRSYLTDSPLLNTWDYKGSKVFVNGDEIMPPVWKQAGQLGDREVPYIDEGYSFREPTKIKLKKGWNEVLIKLPVAEFKGRNWENPSKWMFTFIPVDSKN